MRKFAWLLWLVGGILVGSAGESIYLQYHARRQAAEALKVVQKSARENNLDEMQKAIRKFRWPK